ncbi:ComEC family competence protein [Acetobacter senegalensis]|uniref:ComEC/Rec2 family competence protein n=1 Tax=Acetobacter senegalensis TaxID=446692 RepID=UPI00209E5900|nr:ComEC/Rec2 family competence protein [Acetobacter senegalensis]MCP1196172.1 ComEC family competence protein [Acetobacter senegalensis]
MKEASLREIIVFLKSDLLTAVTALLLVEQRRLVLWVPVGMALGVAGYFGLRQEPSVWGGVALPMLCIGAALLGLWRGWQSVWGRIVAGGCLAVAVGFLAAWLSTYRHPPMPELPRRAVEITGTVQSMAAVAGRDGAVPARMVVLANARFETPLDADMLPLKRTLRVKLKPDDMGDLAPGDEVWVRVMLMPPPFPAFPGGRDLQREAWFANSAGYGRALNPVERLSVSSRQRGWIVTVLEPLRETLDARIRAVLPGAKGAVASTVLTGESASVPRAVREDFAASGLAHLLAVAGLHLGLVMGLLMGLFRLGFALWEWAALRWPCKALSALLALVGGAGYAMLTGLHLPVIRSLIMASIAVLGIAVGRRVVSMRGLALAATLLLLIMPEELLGVAFQMSFAAVMALVAGYEALGPWFAAYRARATGMAHWLVCHLIALALTSLLAGLATLPIVMAHFGQIQPFFVLANLLAVPLMAVWIMPLGLLALLLMPLHLEAMALTPMGWGIELVLSMAHGVAQLPAARVSVPHMPTWGLGAVLLGLCWLCLWRQRWRLWGVVPVALGMLSPLLLVQPDILISPDGGLMAVRDGGHLLVAGRSRDSAAVQAAWAQAFARVPESFPVKGQTPDGVLSCGEDGDPDICLVSKNGQMALLRVVDKTDGMARLPDTLCADMDVVISSAPLRDSCPNAHRLDRFSAWREGAQAVYLEKQGVRVVTDRAVRGARPWVMKPGGHGMPNLPLAPSE